RYAPASSGLLHHSKRATREAPCARHSATAISLSFPGLPTHHAEYLQRLPLPEPKGSIFRAPFTPQGAITRPITTHLVGSRVANPPRQPELLGRGFSRRLVALEKSRHRRAQLRALAAPVRQAVSRETQRLLSFGRLRIVEPDALDEELACSAARIGDHHVEKGPLLGAAARKTNHNHDELTEAEKGVILRELRGGWQGKTGCWRQGLSFSLVVCSLLPDPSPHVGVDSARQRRRIDVDQILGGQSLDESLEVRAVLVGERAALDVERQDPVAFAERVGPVVREHAVRDGLVFLRRRLQTVVGSELGKLGHNLKREADAVEDEQALGICSLHQRKPGAVLGDGLRPDVRSVSDEQLLRDRAPLLGPGLRSSNQDQDGESSGDRSVHGISSPPTVYTPYRIPGMNPFIP